MRRGDGAGAGDRDVARGVAAGLSGPGADAGAARDGDESEWVAQAVEACGHAVVVADANYALMYGQRSRAGEDGPARCGGVGRGVSAGDLSAGASGVGGAAADAPRAAGAGAVGAGADASDQSAARAMRQEGYRLPSGSAATVPAGMRAWASRRRWAPCSRRPGPAHASGAGADDGRPTDGRPRGGRSGDAPADDDAWHRAGDGAEISRDVDDVGRLPMPGVPVLLGLVPYEDSRRRGSTAGATRKRADDDAQN